LIHLGDLVCPYVNSCVFTIPFYRSFELFIYICKWFFFNFRLRKLTVF